MAPILLVIGRTKMVISRPEWTVDRRRRYVSEVGTYPRVRGHVPYNIPLSAKRLRCFTKHYLFDFILKSLYLLARNGASY